ncbi:MAG: hypothetical protein WCK14_09620 [Actinomycetota bacterium]|jgi:hypothetical protein
MADFTPSKARFLIWGAGPLLVAMLASSCSGNDPGVNAGKADQSSATSIAVGQATDGATTLKTAIGQLAAGYHFSSTATVNGAAAVTAVGDRVGDSTRMNVSSKGAAVDYVVTPTATWVNKDGTWSEVTDATAPADPLGALSAPTSVVVTSSGAGAATVLTASYPASALSLPGTAAVDVVFTINGSALSSMSYSTTTDGGAADVHTDITALVDTSPVTVPKV